MYGAFLTAALLLACVPIWLGFRRGSRSLGLLGAALLLAIPLAITGLELWGELLWFQSLGFEARAWREFGYRLAASFLGAAGAGILVWLLTTQSGTEGQGRGPRLVGVAAAVLVGVSWGAATWDELALCLRGVATGVREPALGIDVGFYLFTLPFLDALHGLATVAVVLAFLVAVAGHLHWRRPRQDDEPLFELDSPSTWSARPLLGALAGLGLVLAAGQLLARYHLLHDGGGVVAGAGWTDVHIRMPALWLGAAAFLLTGLVPLSARFRSLLGGASAGAAVANRRVVAGVLVLWVGAGLVTFLGRTVAPAAAQWLVVEPSEVTYEKPYIGHNIAFTRRAFDLDDVAVRSFPADPELDAQDLEENRNLVEEVRLWDPRALAEVYEQFHEIRLYYEFADVDVDRYRLGGRYRQVMVSARELEVGNLPLQSQTFVNRRFVFTHGHGVVMSPVRDFTRHGLPRMLIQDVPSRAVSEELHLERPEIYYGERTTEPVIVNSSEAEFDYPKGDRNVYSHYQGEGGIPLLGPWRRFLFGWKFDGTQLFMSDYPRPESRIMFRRTVRERVAAVAPFLQLDDDPYVVLAEGRLKWILDGYSYSKTYPYSERLPTRRDRMGRAMPLSGVNYLRNSVKAVVDAYDGSVQLYVFEPDDPIVQAWSRVFPGLFSPREEMPETLRAHVRYPADLLQRQGEVYARYHMTDPAVFYNQEDLWVTATETYHGRTVPVEPYYVMWEPPGSDEIEFILMQPFTPKGRQVMVGWIAGRCDGENYGRLLAYKFPKDRTVLGPQQVETKIDQDRFLAGQLTLWDQRGSSVIRGNVLAIPLDDSLLYVEPIYLRADTAAYPELRFVVVMHGDNLTFAPTLDEALRKLVQAGDGPGATAASSLPQHAREAQRAFEDHLRLQAEHDFGGAAEALERLQRTLEDMVQGLP